MALQIAQHNAVKEKQPWLVFSIEMPGEELGLRAIASLGGLSLQRLDNPGRMQDDDWARMVGAVAQAQQAPLFVCDDRGLSAKRKASVRSALDRHLLPRLGEQRLDAVSKLLIDQQLMWPLQERYALSFVRSVYGVLAVAFRQALRLELLPTNPLAALKFTDFVRTRIRPKPARLRGDDVPDLLGRLAERFEAEPAGSMLALMMLCHGSRLGETRLARWRHLNLDAGRWFIPAGDTKTKAEHTLPLTAQPFLHTREIKKIAF